MPYIVAARDDALRVISEANIVCKKGFLNNRNHFFDVFWKDIKEITF
jgi:hypothetical protein